MPFGRVPRFPFDATMANWAAWADRHPVIAYFDSCLRGAGQVVILNNPITGLFILLGLFVDTPWLAVSSLIGVITSTATAYLLRLPIQQIRNGLYGYNGLLVGGALGHFLAPQWSNTVVVCVIAVAAGSTVLMAGLSALFARSFELPVLTLPFNLITIPFLWSTFAITHIERAPILAQHALVSTIDSTLRATPEGPPGGELDGLVEALFNGIAQLFFGDTIAAGVLILLGIAIASRIAAGVSLVASLLGGLLGLLLGADGNAVYMGLWGYNAYITAIAVAGVFYAFNWRVALLGGAAAIAATMAYAGLAVIFGVWGVPVLTLPFCLTTLVFVMLHKAAPHLPAIPFTTLTTPEEHRRRGV